MQLSENDTVQLGFIIEESKRIRKQLERLRIPMYRMEFTNNEIGFNWLDIMNAILKFEDSVNKEYCCRCSLEGKLP